MTFRTICSTTVLCVSIFAASGCSEPKGNVSGVVKFDGSPLPSGKITFICEGGDKPVFSSDIRDGRYEIKGMPVGAAKITVATYKPSAPVERPPGLGPTTRPGTDETSKAPPAKFVEIPSRYGRADSSNLDYTVKPGDQEHEIPLTP